MATFRRAWIPGGTYFFTLATWRRQPLLTHPDAVTALREAFRSVREEHAFEIDALVVLPDHMHAIWTLPPDDADFARRWAMVKRRVSQRTAHLVRKPVSASMTKRRETGVWQRRYWEHSIRDDTDLRRHVDYIHFNPVKHGYARRVADWPYSTFHRYVADGACLWIGRPIPGMDLSASLIELFRAQGARYTSFAPW